MSFKYKFVSINTTYPNPIMMNNYSKIGAFFSLFLFTLTAGAQCTISLGNDDTITCGAYKRLSIESGWSAVSSGTTQNLNSIHFPTSSVGYACGNAGTIIKTTNGGNSFQTLTASFTQNLNRICFANINSGYVVGDGGLILKTNNAGATWDSVYSGVTQSLNAINFISASKGFVGGAAGVILRTIDSGNTWVSSANGITAGQSDQVNDIFFTDSLTGFATVSNTIYKTVNGGVTWSALLYNMTFTYRDIQFLNKDTGFVCGNAGMYFVIRTINGGQTWEQSYTSNVAPFNQITFDTDNNILLAGAGMWKSRDFGLTWQDVITAPQSEFTQNYLRFNAVSGFNLAAGITAGTSGTIYKNQLFDSIVWSPGIGLSDSTVRNPWVNVNNTTTYFVTAKINGCVANDDITIYVNPLKLSARNLYTVSCGDTVRLNATLNLNSSTPGLQFLWSPATYLNQTNIVNPTAVIEKNTRYQVKAITNNGCVDSLSIDVNLNFGAKLTQKLFTMACGWQIQLKTDTSGWGKLFFPDNENLNDVFFLNDTIGFIGGINFLYKTIDGGKTWSSNLIQNGYQVKKIHFRTALLGYVAVYATSTLMRGAILKTTDGGNSWVVQDPNGSGYSLITDLWFTSDLVGYVISNPGKIFKTVNGGSSWVPVNTSVTNYLYAIHFTSSTTGYAAGSGATLLKTTNSGSSWSQINMNIIGGSPEFHAVSFISPDTGYIAGSAGVWKTTDAGVTWTGAQLSTPQNTIITINDMFFVNANYGYVVCNYSNVSGPMNTYGAIYETNNAGLTWNRMFSIDSVQALNAITNIGNSGKLMVIGNSGAVYKNLDAPVNFSWSPTLGLSNANIASPYANPITNTAYVLTANSGNCIINDTATVLVNPIKISAGTDQELVCGDSVKLTPKTLFLNIDASRNQSSWSIVDSNNQVVIKSTPEVVTSGYFYLPSGRYSFVCIPQVIPPPLFIKIAPLHGDSISEEIFFTSDTLLVREFTIPNYNNYSFTWQPQAERIGPNFMPKTYRLTMQTPQGCNAQDSLLVQPVALTLNAGYDKSLICGSSVQLDTLITNYSSDSPPLIRWSNTTVLNDSSSLAPMVSATDTLQLVASIQSKNGCLAFDTVVIKVTPLWVNGFDTVIGCLDTARLRVITNYDGVQPLNYLWTSATQADSFHVASPMVIGLRNTTYLAKVTTWNGCLGSDSVRVLLKNPDAPSICIAGVNENNKNQLVWNKGQVKNATLFHVWRETNITNQYQNIGEVLDSQSFIFIDTASNPFVQSNKYKLVYTDACGLQSYESQPHQTMHLTINKGIGNTWNLIWNSYQGFTVSTYNVYRGNTLNNLQLIGTSAGSNNAYSDLSAPDGDVYYQVELISPNACNPNKTYNSSRSNKVSNKDVGLSVYKSELIQVYPNPANHTLTIFDDNKNLIGSQLMISDLLGRKVMDTKLIDHQIDISMLDDGAYILLIEKEGKSYRGKFVKQ
jgi:photosystem II stability/assembly factor-like uncharacterized protein